jgi:choice-of-anchor A domain-containing protein
LGTSARPSMNTTGKQAYVTIGGNNYALVVGGGLLGTNGAVTFNIDGKGSTDDHFVRFNTLYGSNAEANNSGINIGSPANDPQFRYIRINQSIQSNATVENNGTLVNFSTAFTNFRNESNRIASKSNNITATNSGGQANIILGSNATNVWNVTGATLNSYSQINLTGTLPNVNNALLINVNVTGAFNWNNIRFTMNGESDNSMEINRAPYIIWNFYNNTTNLTILNANLILGSILAPNAIITNAASGNITGQLIAKSFIKPSAGELHIAKFNTTINTGVLAAKTITLSPVYYADQVNVNWQTINELNSNYFEAERSYDGVEFQTIGRLYATGLNGAIDAYTITDKSFNHNKDILYYRIKAIDNNGTVSYSSIASVRINKENQVSVWPNPFTSTVVFYCTSGKTAPLSVCLIDNLGKQVKIQHYTVYKGVNSLTISDLQSIQPGNYYIVATDKITNERVAIKAVKL